MLTAEQRHRLFQAPLLPDENQVAIYDSQSTVNPPEIIHKIMVATPSETGFRNTQQVKSESICKGGPLNDTGLTYKVKQVNKDFVEEFMH